MPTYDCGRCGYNTHLLSDFRKHCSRAKTCDPIINDVHVDFDVFVKKSGIVKNYPCSICSKMFANRQSIHRHRKTCANKRQSSTITQTSPPEVSQYENEPIETVRKTKKKIPISIKRIVWNKYIGETNGTSKCWCCRIR